MKRLNPASLPRCDAIDVLPITSSSASSVTRELDDWQSSHCIRVDETTRAKIDELFRSLPFAESMRCHNPPVGLRFYKGEVLRFAFSICWACNNAFGELHGRPVAIRFDGKSDVAIELFSVIQSVLSRDVLSEDEIE
jgi:hypothetical protein